MKSITREREALDRPPASSDVPASTPATVDSLSRPTKPATRKLRGCARQGCLEVAMLGSDRCPLHD
jgi:hypothetical protein